MDKRNKPMTIIKYMPVLAGISVLFFLLLHEAGSLGKDPDGVPDAVSSSVSGGTCRLTVIANRDCIEDRKLFAEEVLGMCRKNSFRSVRLSTDIAGWPEELDIAVYYYREDIGKGEPVMRIRCESVGGNGEANIADNNPGKYRFHIE